MIQTSKIILHFFIPIDLGLIFIADENLPRTLNFRKVKLLKLLRHPTDYLKGLLTSAPRPSMI